MQNHTLCGRSLALTALLTALASTTHAADPQPAGQLPEMVVTATKTETERWRTASSVTVIDRKQIEQKQFRLLPDALRQVPGLAIVDNGGPGTLAGVFMRGTKTAHTAVLINGRPIPANVAGSFNLETMALDNVERVEVLRGPAASLYGGKTIGGVINIITRSGRGVEKPETTAFFEAGSYGTFREGINTLGSTGALDWALEFGRTDIQGQRLNSQFQQTTGSGRVGYQLADDLRLDLDMRYYTADVGVPNADRGAGANNNATHLLTEFWSLSPRFIWNTTDRWTQTLTFSWNQFRQVATNFTGFNPNNRITVRSQFWEYQSVFKATDTWTITGGLWLQDLASERLNDTRHVQDLDQEETNWAVFLQSQAEILPGWNVIGGARFDSYSDFRDATTWRAATSYRVPHVGTLLHANYGTAFAPPSIQDREPTFFGNPLLVRPERSQGYEFGIEQPIPAAKLSLHATYFENGLRDTYQFAAGALQAIGKARAQGIETGLNWQPCAAFGFNASYTYTESNDLTNRARFVRRPRHMITAAATVKPLEDVTVSFSGSYVMGREDFDPVTFRQVDIEDYLLARVAVNWRVCRHLDLFARVENVFGDQYEEAAGFPAYDTGAYAGLRLRF